MSALPLVVTVIGSALVAWLTASFALSKSYSEKAWDLKAKAYDDVFEALHDYSLYYEFELRDLSRDRDTNPAEQDARLATVRDASSTLKRVIARRIWILPVAFTDRVDKFFLLGPANEALSFADIVIEGHEHTSAAIFDLRAIARNDLAPRRFHLLPQARPH